MELSKKNEIDSCITNYFIDAIKGSYAGEAYCSKVLRREINNEAMPSIMVQWWYCEEYNKVYIYYDLDEVAFIDNRNDMAKRINNRILSSMFTDLHIGAEIVSNVNYGFQFMEPMDSPFVCSNEQISIAILTYWHIENGGYDFIHDRTIILPKMIDYNMDISKDKQEHIQEYATKLLKIAKDYEAYDPNERNAKIPVIFKEIKALFKEYFGYELIDPTLYSLIHQYCGPNVFYLDLYADDTHPEF